MDEKVVRFQGARQWGWWHLLLLVGQRIRIVRGVVLGSGIVIKAIIWKERGIHFSVIVTGHG